jgi:hypothetical protein
LDSSLIIRFQSRLTSKFSDCQIKGNKQPASTIRVLYDGLIALRAYVPRASFHFDGRETGPFAPLLPRGDSFLIRASFKLELPSTKPQTLIALAATLGDCVEFSVRASSILVSRKEVTNLATSRFPFDFQIRRWGFLVFSVSSDGFALTVDANAPLLVNGLVKLNADVSVCVCTGSPERKRKSISADVSAVFVCRTSDGKHAKAAMTLGSIPQSVHPSFVCCFNPAASKDSTVFSCGPSMTDATFRG